MALTSSVCLLLTYQNQYNNNVGEEHQLSLDQMEVENQIGVREQAQNSAKDAIDNQALSVENVARQKFALELQEPQQACTDAQAEVDTAQSNYTEIDETIKGIKSQISDNEAKLKDASGAGKGSIQTIIDNLKKDLVKKNGELKTAKTKLEEANRKKSAADTAYMQIYNNANAAFSQFQNQNAITKSIASASGGLNDNGNKAELLRLQGLDKSYTVKIKAADVLGTVLSQKIQSLDKLVADAAQKEVGKYGLS